MSELDNRINKSIKDATIKVIREVLIPEGKKLHELNMRIAELKGWRDIQIHKDDLIGRPPVEYAELFFKGMDEDEFFYKRHSDGDFYMEDRSYSYKEETAFFIINCWSTSDAKALELVDEIESISKFPDIFDFYLIRRRPGWHSYFLHVPSNKTFDGDGKTRPEAICRAYIAAREWMAKKEKT